MNGNNMELYDIASSFWKNSESYPEYGTIKQRRLYEINYLITRLKGKTLLDLGCGDGALLNCLINLIDFDHCYGYDYSSNLLENLHPDINKRTFDLYQDDLDTLPETDETIFAGVLPFIFEDDHVLKILKSIKSERLFVRSPCTLNEESELVNTYSENLKSNYASYYRTLEHLMSLVKQTHKIESVDRIYPDHIESQFGTRQFYIIGTKK